MKRYKRVQTPHYTYGLRPMENDSESEEQLVPSAICTNKEKHTRTASATYHGCELSTSPKQKRKTASKNNAKNCAQMRPRNPTYLKRTSLLIPPKDLANRFIKPKAPAKAEASAAGSWKYVLKCVASWLFMASVMTCCENSALWHEQSAHVSPLLKLPLSSVKVKGLVNTLLSKHYGNPPKNDLQGNSIEFH